jgi:lysine-N-methylase
MPNHIAAAPIPIAFHMRDQLFIARAVLRLPPMRTIALKYLGEFSCIGGECEDDCCSGWAVTLEEGNYRALAERLGRSEEGRAELAASVAVLPPGEDNSGRRRPYALMVLDDDRHCRMLGADRLCKIQKRFGEEAIPDPCAVFPRTSGAVGGRFELSATISCPEIARRCLLHDDSTDPIEVDKERIVRGLLYKTVRGDESPYHAAFDVVRSAVMGVLSHRDVPVATRLFALAWFAEQTRPWLHDRATTIDREAISRLLQLLRQAETYAQFEQGMRSAASDVPFAASVVQQVLVSSRQDPAPAFLRIVDHALGGDGEADPVKLLAAHRQRVAALPSETVAKLQVALEAFCKNFAFKDWFIKAPSFKRWLYGLFIRVSMLRYLVIAHPAAHSAPDKAIVETAYSMTRTFEHDLFSMPRILDQLEGQGMQTLAHAIALLTF